MAWHGETNPYESPRLTEEEIRARVPLRQRVWTREEIFETIAELLVNALGVDREEVTREASLVRDLGAG